VGAQASYSTIVITVNVENGSEASLTSNFAVSGGGESNLANDSITDTTLARLPTVTTFTATPNPSALSQSVTLTATVTTGASGRVEFYSGATLLGSALLAGGQSVFTTSSLPSGTGSLRADYLGDSNYGPSISAPQTQTVTTDAENGFVPYTSYSIPTGATWIGAADLNGDGVTDLITVNPYNVAVLLGNGDGTFRTPVSYSYGNTFGSYITNSGLIADLNNDGHPDVVVATSNGMFMLLGNGDGTFRPAILFTSSASYSSLVAADFNRDGNLDLACLGPGGILLYSGNGDGTFQPPITLPSSSNGYNFVTAADLNRDGKPDLVALNSNSQTVGVFLGNGDGTFQLLTSSVGVFSPMGLVVGDFNGDGVPDLALSYLWGAIVLPGNGDGTFKTGVQTALSGRATPDWYSLVAGYFNGDGKLDLAFGGSGPTGPPGVTVFFGNGDGSFRQGPFLPSDAASSTAIAVGDYNRDSKLDIALTANAPGTIDVYLGGWFAGLQVSSTHSGGLTIGQTGTYRIGVNNYAFVPTSSTVTVTDTLPSGLTATAMSGTGWACTLSTLTCTRSDALTIDAAYPVITLSVRVAATLLPSVIDNQVTVTYAGFASSAIDPTMIVSPTTTTLTISPSPAILGQQVTLTATVTPGAAGTVLFLGSAVALGSASVSNGQAILTTRLLPSGRQYLIATYSGDSTYAPSSSAEIYQTVSSAPANAFAPQASYLAGTTPWAIAAGDFNHDGRTDLVVTNYDGNSISVLPGNGDGTFGPHVDYPVGTAPTSVTVADFNGDGQPDIAVGNDSGPAVSILLGNPDGSFQPAVHFSTPFGSSSLAASDFNGDGKIDLATSGDYALTILLGNGDGTFQPGVIYDVTGALADFNLDGKVDIYSAANGILPGNGDGTFQSGSYSGYSFSARSIVAGDLNGDGKPDIVAADNFGNIVVILGNGDGTFRSAQYPAAGVVAMSVLLADVNGDGKLDVVALNNGSNNVSVLLGNGDGTLQSAIAYPVCQAQAAVSADFNGDGRTDIAITCPVSNNITVLLGLLTPTLTIASSHADPIAIGQAGATYSLTVANSGPGVTSGQLKVVDTLPAGLTATAIQGTGWTCTLATLTCTNSTPLAANASYSPIIVSVTPTTIGSGANQVAVSGGGAANATAYDPTTIVGPAIIQTTPPNLQFSVDGTAAQTAPQALNLAPGTHTIAVAATQSGTPGTQYVFTGWSDSGAASHTITVGATSATYTATFQTQYLLTTAAFPQSGGTVTPASGTYYDSGSLVTLTASTNSPLTFTGWSGATGTTNPLQITMNAPLTITAAFDIPGATCTMTGDATASITDVQFIVNEALGIMPANNDLNNDGTVNIADIQKVLDAALKLGCLH
jgi:uncharacterized repeat protein (TIGR01451 family)